MKINLKQIAKVDWFQRWAGSYTFISCSYWGPQYYFSLDKALKVSFRHSLFIHRKGTAAAYASSSELGEVGSRLAKKTVKDPAFAKKYCLALKKNTDILSRIMESKAGKIPSWEGYENFLAVFERHLALHVFVKYTVDFLPAATLKKLLPYFEDARLYSEKIYSQSETFFRSVAGAIAQKEKYNPQYLTCLTQKEFESYLKNKPLPKPAVLKERFNASGLFFKKGKLTLIPGRQASRLEKLLLQQRQKNNTNIKGISAYPGKIAGTARIVPDPFKVKVFNSGDILVTGMTRPEFLPLIKKAGAIVTESGGILSHAAIIARELKKPCIVGTQVITKVLREGDMVEVDANKGIVKKI